MKDRVQFLEFQKWDHTLELVVAGTYLLERMQENWGICLRTYVREDAGELGHLSDDC